MPSRTRSTSLAVLVLAVSLLGVACTGSSTPTDSPGPSTSSGSPGPTESPITGQIKFVPGEFALDLSDVLAHFSWTGGTGTLKVTNHSADPIGAPTMFAVTQAETVIHAEVSGGGGQIAPGKSVAVQVTFPDPLDPADAGLLIIGFGDVSYGALSPVVAP